jgi:hypothetical protein
VDRERAELRGGLMRYVAASGALFVVFMVVMFVEQPASRMVRNLLEGA